ncbi:unnamed protein product [Urochloa humidicola]
MEGRKRDVVAACCLLVVLLSDQHQPAAAMTKFCRCYNKCYTDCRKDMGLYPCNIQCFEDCINGQLPPASPADCGEICVNSFCGGVMDNGAMAAAPGEAEACVAECTNKLGAFAPTAPPRSTTEHA